MLSGFIFGFFGIKFPLPIVENLLQLSVLDFVKYFQIVIFKNSFVYLNNHIQDPNSIEKTYLRHVKVKTYFLLGMYKNSI